MVAQPNPLGRVIRLVEAPAVQFLDDIDCPICTDKSCITCQALMRHNADWLLRSVPEEIHGYSESGESFEGNYYGMYA